MFAFLDCVRYNDDFVKSGFVISRFCSLHLFCSFLVSLSVILSSDDRKLSPPFFKFTAATTTA